MYHQIQARFPRQRFCLRRTASPQDSSPVIAQCTAGYRGKCLPGDEPVPFHVQRNLFPEGCQAKVALGNSEYGHTRQGGVGSLPITISDLVVNIFSMVWLIKSHSVDTVVFVVFTARALQPNQRWEPASFLALHAGLLEHSKRACGTHALPQPIKGIGSQRCRYRLRIPIGITTTIRIQIHDRHITKVCQNVQTTENKRLTTPVRFAMSSFTSNDLLSYGSKLRMRRA